MNMHKNYLVHLNKQVRCMHEKLEAYIFAAEYTTPVSRATHQPFLQPVA